MHTNSGTLLGYLDSSVSDNFFHFLMQARVEHLLMQNKELINHLQKLMAQLQQMQSLGLSQQTSIKSSTPTQDDPSTAETPVATTTSPHRQSSPIPSPSQLTTLPSSTSPPKSPPIATDDNKASLVLALTSTPSPTSALTTISESKDELGTAEPVAPSEDRLGTSGFGGLGSLDIDVDLLTTSALPDDPFAPLPSTSNSAQLTES